MTTSAVPQPANQPCPSVEVAPVSPPAMDVGAIHQTNTMAILSLVFAFLFWPLSIVFGHMGLAEIKRTREAGRGLAIAGLAISYTCAGFIVLLVVAAFLSFQ